MDHLNPFYDEAISENFFALERFNQGMSQNEINQLMYKLVSTIDLPRLNEFYFQQLQTQLQLVALKIQFDDHMVVLGNWHEQIKHKTLSCMQNDHVVAQIHYGFERTLSAKDWQILQQMHLYFANPLKNALEHYKVKQFAMKDFLTSLGNRANYNETITRMISQAERQHTSFGLLVIDLDNFKTVNDSYGHHEGDKVLIAFANIMTHSLRDTDFAFRFGGDEFCCLLSDTTANIIQQIAERINAAIKKDNLLNKHQVSCSIGSTFYKAHDTALNLFSRADSALYKAKKNGRNGVFTAA